MKVLFSVVVVAVLAVGCAAEVSTEGSEAPESIETVESAVVPICPLTSYPRVCYKSIGTITRPCAKQSTYPAPCCDKTTSTGLCYR